MKFTFDLGNIHADSGWPLIPILTDMPVDKEWEKEVAEEIHGFCGKEQLHVYLSQLGYHSNIPIVFADGRGMLYAPPQEITQDFLDKYKAFLQAVSLKASCRLLKRRRESSLNYESAKQEAEFVKRFSHLKG